MGKRKQPGTEAQARAFLDGKEAAIQLLMDGMTWPEIDHDLTALYQWVRGYEAGSGQKIVGADTLKRLMERCQQYMPGTMTTGASLWKTIVGAAATLMPEKQGPPEAAPAPGTV